HARLLDEDTHLSLRTEVRGDWLCTSEKRTVEVDYEPTAGPEPGVGSARTSPSTFLFLPSSRCQRADPGCPDGLASLEAELPNFGEQGSSSGHPAAPLPFPEVASEPGRQGLRRQR